MNEEEWAKLKFERLANFGFTEAGSAITDAIWFTTGYQQVGMVLICDRAEIRKAYIGVVDPTENISEENCAKHIAQFGAKLPRAIAQTAFPNKLKEEMQYG
ncbi:MAG: hypothetical protein WCD18_15920 [Thermosynechococcaceae cyanobacterium]